ncbi:hypothetical protein [Streptomyces indicus]|uniref:Uncharacterized protein n=1 Tax=Streptomyces indicus TaxID=417292 RepID=A0A1G8ZUR2_9ACTN|nr:hypothetical protein [Streptomyces indicus]SDK18737.1 hypothetical protein SAMN05421806_105201 [Streptomyces indicus]
MKRRSMITVLALPAALFLAGCADSATPSPGTALSAERTTSSAPSSYPGTQETLPPRKGDDLDPAEGPATPKTGTWYPHDIHSHCGIEATRFAGKTWVLRTVRTDLTSPVPLDRNAGREAAFNYMAGYIQLQEPELAVFVSSQLPPLELVPGTSNRACD